jgi:folate-binding protein YgfZ
MGADRAVNLAGYDAVLEGAAYYTRRDGGFLRLTGSTRLDFIQRQTTNDVNLLTDDQVLTTVLTTPNARMLDVWMMVDEGESVGIVTLPGNASSTASFLQSRIFFNDEVAVEDRSDQVAQIELIGPDAGTLVDCFGLSEPLLPERVCPVEIDGVGGRILGFVSRALLLAPADGAQKVAAALENAGAAPLTAEAYNLLRIEAGLPTAGAELTEDYTPLEAGLDYAISGTKGCYTGQEVIARQITYDKVTRRLVGLKLRESVFAGAPVMADGRSVGVVTSSVDSPRFGPIALAYVKRPYHEPAVEVAVGEPAGVMGIVAALPFS